MVHADVHIWLRLNSFGLWHVLQIKLAEDLEARKKQIVKQQASIKTLADEVQKANQIIKKLQDEIKGYASKVCCSLQLCLFMYSTNFTVK